MLQKKIKNELVQMNEQAVKTFSLDDFVRVLPAGKCAVVETGIGEQSSEK